MSEPSITTEPTDWRSLGACRQEDPELFFPVAQTGPGLVQLDQARAICARCEVRAECLDFALETVQDHGVWGGKSEDERRALRRARLRGSRSARAARQARPQAGRSRRERAGANS
jgi:WhiB family transcriptional regulator, redox-sensing transcriptional regulator